MSETDSTDTLEPFNQLEPGDRVLYNDKRDPLEVTAVEDDAVYVEGPKGGEYMLFKAPDADILLVAKPGNREYASKVEELRTVGTWERTEDDASVTWTHSRTDVTVTVEQNDIGYWAVDVADPAGDVPDDAVDAPQYGFTDQEHAVEAAEKLVRDHAEGEIGR